ncbi:alpha/beta hydrolase family protein [Glycomyces terrestris]|uniref:Platelet-activating factor acetylhydrolase n=1 Tax=Glycomyces terrestris TaxID=2493553 RepID=A0A426V2T4_9ACTN|nr:hypothetical protein [Glycomyces terrestris]RRS01223.1 hypothetical protein EIW28_00090 [Glycomyces terrestris]
MSPVEIVAMIAAAAAVSAYWLPRGARRPVFASALVAVAVAAVVLGFTGLRWQAAPMLAAAAIACAARVCTRRRVRRWAAVAGTAGCAGLVAATPVASWAMPVAVYPEPTGPFAVGAAVVEWTDEARPEPFTADPDDRRVIVAQFWYPAEAAPGAERAFAGRETAAESRLVTESSAEFFGIPPFLVADTATARSHAVFGAPAAGTERYPVVVFSPGLSATRTANTVLAEEWASRGYVVVTVDHTFDAAVTVVGDEPVAGRNTVPATEAEAARANRENLGMRTADLSFVLSQVEDGAVPEPLAGRVDAGRAAVAGHSRGAAAALATAAADPRFDAVVHLDGGLEPSLPPGPFGQPALSIVSPVSADRNPDYLPELDRALEAGTGERLRIELPGAGHFSFTDAALYFPPLPSVLGAADRREGLRATAEATGVFLDAALRAVPTDLASELARYGPLTEYA